MVDQLEDPDPIMLNAEMEENHSQNNRSQYDALLGAPVAHSHNKNGSENKKSNLGINLSTQQRQSNSAVQPLESKRS